MDQEIIRINGEVDNNDTNDNNISDTMHPGSQNPLQQQVYELRSKQTRR